MREMGSLSGVEIEPPQQTKLLDDSISLAGVIGGGVPGGTSSSIQFRVWGLIVSPRSRSGRVRRRVAPSLRSARAGTRYQAPRTSGTIVGISTKCHAAPGRGERSGEWSEIGGLVECEGVGGGRESMSRIPAIPRTRNGYTSSEGMAMIQYAFMYCLFGVRST